MIRRVAIAGLLLVPACATRQPASQPRGVLTVGVSTSGPGIAGLSFEVGVEPGQGASRSEPIKADAGVLTLRDLSDGSYTVRLTVPSRCQVDGAAERRVVVSPRRTTAVRFSARCR